VNPAARSVAFFLLAPLIHAAELSRDALAAWDHYIQTATGVMKQRQHGDRPFLWIDSHPQIAAQVRSGKIAIAPMSEPNPKRVPDGLIHHWIGAIFLRGARLDDVLAVVRDYDHYKNFYPSAVLASRALSLSDSGDRFSITLVSRAALARTALESQDQSNYFQLDARHWYSISSATRLQEIDNYGESDQQMLPPDEGHGYVWRLFAISRFEQRDDGVYLETEAIALSRDIPAAVRWVVDPIVRRIARDSLSTTLRRTEDAVRSAPCRAARAMTQP
jgi:hypothetical protein